MNSEFSDPMDASLAQLERELQSLTPAAPSRALMRSLQERMEPVMTPVAANRVTVFPWRRMVAPAAAAAAAVAVMGFQNSRRNGIAVTTPADSKPAEDAPPAIKWEPMPMRSEYRTLLNNGYVLNENMEPVQELLMNRVDHHEWRNPADNSSIRLTIPRQQRVTVPAGFSSTPPAEAPKQRLQFQ